MMNFKKILLSFAFYFAAFFCIAQQLKNDTNEAKYRVVNWGLDEGLSNAGIWAVTKDVNGFLWVATSFGLNRFDGSTFKKYIADTTKKNKTIPGNSIDNLIEDSLHNIWISTNKGIACYDTKADTFRSIFPNLPKEVNPFWATKDEVFFWDFAEQQWVAYNIHSFAKRTLGKFASTDTVAFGASQRYAIFDTGSNSIWMKRGYQGTGGGLLQVSITNGKKLNFNWPCFRNIPNHSHRSEGMRFDHKRNSIWIASPDGLVEFTLNDKKFHNIEALNELENVKDFWEWAGIDIDKDGKIWICTATAGIIVYDPANDSVQLTFPNNSAQQKDLSDGNLFLYCDKEGMLWSGGFSGKGIYQVIPFSAAVKRYVAGVGQKNGLTSNSVYRVVNAGHGTLWLSTSDGLNIFDPHTEIFNLLRVKDLKGATGKGPAILPFVVDSTGKKAMIYIDYDEPYFEMDIVSRKCSPILYEDSNGKRVPLQSVLANHPQHKFPIAYKNGLIIVISRPDHQEILEVNGDPVARKILSLPDGTVAFDLSAVCTNDDNLLFLKRQNAATNLTYRRRNNNWILTPTPLDSIGWSMINYNKTDQTYWIIAETKLLHYDKNFRVIRNYTSIDGMPGVEVHALINDNKGNVWFTTDRSIFQLNTKTGVIAMLSEKDGLSQQNFGGPFFGAKDDVGDLYITGGNGLNRISPDKYVSSASSVYFESLKINQTTYPLSAAVNNVQELSLKYSDNNIVIETGIIDYYSKGKGHIRYKLETEGKKADWQYAPAYYTIRYEQLPPGKYRLVIQSSNAANEFNGPEKTLLIHISPAFWNTWWFRTAAIVLLGILFYGLIRWRLQQRFRLQLERSEKETQIADIKQKATELEMQALRAQMNPHFIFNSLNSINRFILQNNRLQASEYLTKFSKLVRMILQNSQSPLIPLESELESLGLYLEMEALRFNYHFDYKIFVPKDIDIEMLKVPPLILQPYVENAIWHGLMHKEEKGQLTINVSQEDDHLYFKIMDNGIGRKKASEIAGKSATKHKSMGLRITANRIAMLQSSNGGESPVKINDLMEPDGAAAGTEVVIKMPVIMAD